MSAARIAILVHSTNPRGAVVHGMQLAEALCAAGHDATLLAPDSTGRGFFRTTRCRAVTIPALPERDVAALVQRRIDELATYLAAPQAPQFDHYHAQDPITANALADLSARGRIPGFVRTVHHLDHFDDPRLAARQERGMRAASRLGVVSRLWQDRLQDQHALAATLLGNGVDTSVFSPLADGRDAELRRKWQLEGAWPVILTLGGIEARKNTLGTLQAFLRLRETYPTARLMIAGGATLLDHSVYRARFVEALHASGAAASVIMAGVVAAADMPALYRIADVLACPSLAEGFGLCPLEAMAAGRPAVVSAIAPFTEHLGPDEVLWADPHDVAAMEAAFATALRPEIATRLRQAGPLAASRFGWDRVAAAHLPFYGLASAQRETVHA